MNNLEIHDLTIMVVDSESDMPYLTYKAASREHLKKTLDSIIMTTDIDVTTCGKYLDLKMKIKDAGIPACPCPTCQPPIARRIRS